MNHETEQYGLAEKKFIRSAGVSSQPRVSRTNVPRMQPAREERGHKTWEIGRCIANALVCCMIILSDSMSPRFYTPHRLHGR